MDVWGFRTDFFFVIQMQAWLIRRKCKQRGFSATCTINRIVWPDASDLSKAVSDSDLETVNFLTVDVILLCGSSEEFFGQKIWLKECGLKEEGTAEQRGKKTLQAN